VWFDLAEVARLRISVSDDFATAGSSSPRTLYIKQIRNRDSRTRDAGIVLKLLAYTEMCAVISDGSFAYW